MNKTTSIIRFVGIFMATLISFCAQAQNEGQMALGYSGRVVTKSSDWGLDDSGTLSAAIRLDPEVISGLDNLKICGVSAGLASRLNVENITVWVRSSLSGENLAEATASPKKGWNDLVFETPCNVDGEDCYVGYTLELSGCSYPVSIVDGNSPYGFYLNTGEGWVTPETETPSVLSLLAIIEADNMRQYDLSLDNALIPDRIKIGSSAPVELTLSNAGSRSVNGVVFKFTENGIENGLYSAECSLTPGTSETVTIDYFPTGTVRLNDCPLTIEISYLADGEDEFAGNNSFTGSFNLCKFDFKKRLFIEEFTTEKCSNCPRAAEMIHEILNEPAYEDRLVVCARHSGFGTDYFTSDIDLEMLEMYGEGEGTFCPAIMLDRTPFYSNGVPVMSVPTDKSDFINMINRCLANPANVDLSVDAIYDPETDSLKVTVSGGRDGEFGNTPARVSVYLVENDIYDPRQLGADGAYYQQHVVRDANSTWGEIIEWDSEDEFSYTCELDVSKVHETGNTEIVAIVNDYDAYSISNRVVNNSVSSKAIDWTGASIKGVMADPGLCKRIEYYDLNGMTIADPASYNGVMIKKIVNEDNTISVSKVMKSSNIISTSMN